jgi:hypothetical protein
MRSLRVAGSFRTVRPAIRHVRHAALLAALSCTGLGAQPPAVPAADPLAAEIERWSASLKTDAAADEMSSQVRKGSLPAMVRTEDALRDGRRSLALLRLSLVRVNLAANRYRIEAPKALSTDPAELEAEWRRAGEALGADLAPRASALDGVRPAVVRAVGEASLAQIRAFYEASLDYGRATMPEYGLFYLGQARAQREFVAFCRTLAEPSLRPAPKVRSIGPELDALEGELLAAYRAPASIDRHDEFILASSLLKEARELDAAGLRYGALLRYGHAAVRTAMLRPPASGLEGEGLARTLDAWEARLASSAVDQTIGGLFLEMARADVAAAAPGKSSDTAVAVAGAALPLYAAALEPADPAGPAPEPRVTVTLVRWPYT